MNRNVLFGGLPGYTEGADWSRIVMHEEPYNQLLERFEAVKTGATLAGIEIVLNRFMSRNKILVQNSNGEVVSIINLEGD